MNAGSMELFKKNSLVSWLATDITNAVAAINLVYLALYLQTQEFNFSIYSKTCISIIVIMTMPYVLIKIMFHTMEIKQTLQNIILKISISVLLSLIIMTSMDEIRPLEWPHSTLLTALGIFALTTLLLEIHHNQATAIPNLIHRVLIVGNSPQADQMQRLLSTEAKNYHLAGRVHFPHRRQTAAHPNHGVAQQQSDLDLHAIAKERKANKILIALAERRGVFPLQETLACKLSGIEILDAPTLYERITGKLLLESITPSWFIFCHGFQLPWLLMTFKRVMDIGCALLGILLSIPFVPCIVLAIKLDSHGPILFSQTRVGKGDKEFKLYKFRTMCNNAEKSTGAVWASSCDNRITKVGSFLRKSRIDELPQLINVLRGEMSLVGPRPERPEFVTKLKDIIPYYSERHFIKPGITGWAQVRYPYGATVEDALEKLRYDLYYIKNLTLLLDIVIIFKTMLVVLFRKGGR